MPRTKGGKNRAATFADFGARIKKLQKDKEMLEDDLSKAITRIEELKTDIRSPCESLKLQSAEIKQTEKEITKLRLRKQLPK